MAGIGTYLKRMVRFIAKGEPKKSVYVSVATLDKGKSLDGKCYIITGGSSGIGYATAQKCISEGAKVVITGTNIEKLEAAKTQLGEQCDILQYDITDIKSAENKIKQAVELLGGKLDGVVCNAGIHLGGGRTIDNCKEADWDIIFQTNLKGLYFSSKWFIEYLKENKAGSIVMVASESALYGRCEPYAFSKAGVINYTKGLSKELLPYGIRTNAVAPGMTVSNCTEANHVDPKGDLYYPVPGERILLPEEIAEVIFFLLSDASKCINGQILECNQGKTVL